MRVLVLGAYGLIGQAVVRAALSEGVEVSGLAREPARGAALLPQVRWLAGNLNRLLRPEDWLDRIEGIDAVVNASGALQSGLQDDLGRVQRDAIVALIKACELRGVSGFVQISAPGAKPGAATEFLATKGEADAALRASDLKWVVLKPGLVISPTAYGGTSLVRTLAAFPYVQPIALAEARLQTIWVDDVASAVVRSLSDERLARADFDLVAPQIETLENVVLTFRSWLGFSEPAWVWRVPKGMAMALARCADLAGLLGWRAPLRSTAMKVLKDDVVADPEPWRRATGQEFAALAETLGGMPATRQERVFARVQLVFPLLVVAFAAFWIASGLIGLWRFDEAARLIIDKVGTGYADLAVLGGSLVDIAVGAGLLLRRSFVPACAMSVAVSLTYLLAGSIVTPQLWGDPLGPLVKVIPVIGLALALVAMAEER
ncbi:MAG: SDR family oxidoreductase [Alphaproteobacteria bacterium]|nr:SDR family oxidoreductase [Alphaproteobacteria bacterium]